MPVLRLIIAPAAKTDLKDIYQLGLGQWGQEQSDSTPTRPAAALEIVKGSGRQNNVMLMHLRC
jgi:hypothetical protein